MPLPARLAVDSDIANMTLVCACPRVFNSSFGEHTDESNTTASFAHSFLARLERGKKAEGSAHVDWSPLGASFTAFATPHMAAAFVRAD